MTVSLPTGIVWAEARRGQLQGFHRECDRCVNVQASQKMRQPRYTTFCMGCGHFLDAEPCEHTLGVLGLSEHTRN